MFWEREPVSLGLPGGGEGSLPAPPTPYRAGSEGASAATLLQPPPRTLGIPTSSAAPPPGNLVLPPLFVNRTIPTTSVQAHGMDGMP